MTEQKQTESATQEVPADEKRKIILKTLLAVVAVALVAGGIFWAWFKIQEGRDRVATLQDQIAKIEKSAQEKQGEMPADSGTSAAVTTDEYAGWKTYHNYPVGYSLRYPADWSVEEKIGISEIFEEPVNYVVFHSPGKKHFLTFGLKPSEAGFHVTERTGMGVGENKPDGTLLVLENQVKINRFISDGITSEISYPSAWPEKINGGKTEMAASFGSESGEVDLASIPERKLAEKILKSAAYPADAPADCPSQLTASDLEAMKGWKEYKNEDQGYSFRYPANWSVTQHRPGYVSLGSDSEKTSFQWMSGSEGGIEIYGSKTEGEKEVAVACQKTVVLQLAKGDEESTIDADTRVITAHFERAGTLQFIKFDYKYTMGASIASDFIEAFDLILKSVEFN